MSETSLSNATASATDHFNRAAASLKAAERDARTAISRVASPWLIEISIPR